MTDTGTTRKLEAVVRGLTSAAKALRLYPSSSPIPRESAEAAATALEAYLTEYPVLSLSIAREGFEWMGTSVAAGAAGVADLANELRERGVAEIDFTSGCSVGDIITFLSIAGSDPASIGAQGGMGAALAGSGVECVRVADVHLTVIEEIAPEAEGDIDEFLRQLAADPDKLSMWMAASSAGDPAAFAEGLEGLVGAAGAGGMARLLESLAQAFTQQGADGKDALLGLALEQGAVRDLAGGMFGFLDSKDLASSLCDGLFGKNMLSLSNVMTHLPLQERMNQVYAEVQRELAAGGHADKELDFLRHMMDVRAKTEAEEPLVDADPTYHQVAQALTLSEADIEHVRETTRTQSARAGFSGVSTMLALLDQQRDFDLYCQGLDNLASMVPRLLDSGDFDLAVRIFRELAGRESRSNQPWPELSARLRQAISTALGHRSIASLMKALIEDPARLADAREIVLVAGDAATAPLVQEAIAQKAPGIRLAEEILGRRLIDVLVAAAPQAQWFQLGPIVERLAHEGDARSLQAIRSLLARQDEQSRREVAQGLAGTGSPAALQMMETLIRDTSPEVAIIAVRAIARHQMPGGAGLLVARIGELDIDGKDFAVGREIIGALARLRDPESASALRSLAARRALIKRGHFLEIQDLVRQALLLQQEGGAS
ncbi:MAG: HEAT repeat domain-containing protein [Actinomycetota bacterium]|nr:HEAT repeat domain-containing protein [Actinomycetota bacterium]